MLLSPPSLSGPPAVMVRDGGCSISGYIDGVELAHLILAKEKERFVSNQMSKYCRFTTSQHRIMSDDQNIVLLRSDLHNLFDMRHISMVPKQVDIDTTHPPQLLVHILNPGTSAQIVPLYHNRCLQPIQGLSKEFMFARFAWSLFTDECIPFVSWPGMFNILLWNKITNLVETRVCTSKDVSSFSQVFDSSIRSQSRSISPKKRQMTDAFGWYSDCTSSDGEERLGDDGYFGDPSLEQDAPRGRALFRTSVRESMPTKRRFNEAFSTPLMSEGDIPLQAEPLFQAEMLSMPEAELDQPATPTSQAATACLLENDQKRVQVEARCIEGPQPLL